MVIAFGTLRYIFPYISVYQHTSLNITTHTLNYTCLVFLNRTSATQTSIENPKQGGATPPARLPLVIPLPFSPFFPLTSHRHPYNFGLNLCEGIRYPYPG